MMRFRKLRIGIDVDDVLYECTPYAVRLANEEYGKNMTVDQVTEWGPTGGETDILFHYYKEPWFYEQQPIIPGAKEFVAALCEVAEVFFVTAVYPEAMTVRAMRLMKDFPEVPRENLILSYRKDLVHLDIVLDDGAHNVMASQSTYPVLMRRPWNQKMTGCLSVNSYNEFLTIVHTIQTQSAMLPERKTKAHKLFAFVGPSASGKSLIIDKIVREKKAVKVTSYTTRPPREGEVNGTDYYFVDETTFRDMEKSGEFLESSRYAGECYGTTYKEIRKAIRENDVVVAVDIGGAMALKGAYGSRARLIYVDRPRQELLTALLNRTSMSVEKKVLRIISMDDERKNENLCDVTIKNNVPIDSKEMDERIAHVLS